MTVLDTIAQYRVPGFSVYCRFADALVDPARRRRTMVLFALGYALVWWGFAVVSKSAGGLNADMAEMAIWGREPALGYPKHPPLLAWLVEAWFTLLPATDWAFYLLAALNLGLSLYLAWVLAGEWLDGPKRALAPLLLSLIPFYNHIGLKFDQNSALIPLWALTTLCFWRSLKTRSPGYAALAGVFAAAGMLSKYWTVFLLLALVLAAFADRRRWAYLRSPAPWITTAVSAALCAPHLYWLIREDFPPLRWVNRREWVDFATSLRDFAEYTFGTLGYAAIALVPLLIVLRPRWSALREGLLPHDPDRRTVMVMFWAPLIVPLGIALFTHTQPLSLWNEPSLGLLPVVLLGAPQLTVTREHVARFAALAAAFAIGSWIAAPFIAYNALKTGGEADGAYAQEAAAALEAEWHRVTPAPLKLVAGTFGLSARIAFYLPDRPSSIEDFRRYLAPWAPYPRIRREGAVAIVPADDRGRRYELSYFLQGRAVALQKEITLTPHWLGFSGSPRRYAIAVIPPQP
jgi:4-amino-4-deoxy-L-arabinose transferase-like glycosyltransferase